MTEQERAELIAIADDLKKAFEFDADEQTWAALTGTQAALLLAEVRLRRLAV
jgi:hypothetical protein